MRLLSLLRRGREIGGRLWGLLLAVVSASPDAVALSLPHRSCSADLASFDKIAASVLLSRP